MLDVDSLNKLLEENRRLKEEVYRLREESREKDALISTLESQITALVVDGRESNKKDIDSEEETDYDIESHIDSRDDVDESNVRNSNAKVSANVFRKDRIEGNRDSVDEISNLVATTERMAINSQLHKKTRDPSLLSQYSP